MKTQEEIEAMANNFVSLAFSKQDLYDGFINGYTQCQEDMADELKIIAKKVWQDIFNNETLIYNNFEDYYNDKLNKQD